MRSLFISGVLVMVTGQLARAEGSTPPQPTAAISQLGELEQPATTVDEWVAQIETALVQITGVRVKATDVGLQVVLETENGSLAVPETRAVGNALIADIPNAAIAQEFSQAEPIEGIALVEVTELPGDRVRIAITGTAAPPTAEVTAVAEGLVLAVTTGEVGTTAEEDAIQVVVTGEQESYNPSEASTATRTDTPLRDIPQSIQVVPRQVIEDRNPRTLLESVETVSGVISRGSNYGIPAQSFTIRGFQQDGNFRNGYRDVDRFELTGGTNTIDRVEVLKGPGSVLFGQVEPGGIVNVITRQPLSEPYYNVAFEAGNFGYYQPIVDLSGPITADDTVLYRLIGSYESAGSFQDFVETDLTTVAPSITLNLGDRTQLNLYYEYLDFNGDPPISSAALLSDGSLTSRDRYLSYPDLSSGNVNTQRAGVTLNHEFSDSLQIRSFFSVISSATRNAEVYGASLTDDRFLAIEAYDLDYTNVDYIGQIDAIARFETGAIAHQLLVGFDFNVEDDTYLALFDTDLPRLDISDPDYDVSEPNYQPFGQFKGTNQAYGVFLQDQIAFSDNLKLLIGGRYDWISSYGDTANFGVFTPGVTRQSDGAFSPRIGLVYQPSDAVSLYTSYSRSFAPSLGFSATGEAFAPTRGTQYEIGVRADFFDGRLSTNLAAYHLTKTNVTTADPDNRQFSIQTGEQRSQGIELDVTGEILPGWNVIASYAFTDAEVTADNNIPEGNQLANVPENQASLWTTYEIQGGDLEGLGFGLGLFYVGEREGNLDNSFQIDDYLRTDAALYYRRDRLRAAINIRNLLNIDYVNTSSGPLDLDRGAPFTVVGSVRWEL